MSPPSATGSSRETNGNHTPSTKAPLEPGISESRATKQAIKFPGPPKFEDKYKEREYLKGRLAAAFRIFGKYGFDEGVAGHITVREYDSSLSSNQWPSLRSQSRMQYSISSLFI